ncbi:MAG: hypothetical protein HZA54_17015 [Planctomycetes bacterium]|nr:hypothetical protein [Planctomycetota bacterium]
MRDPSLNVVIALGEYQGGVAVAYYADPIRRDWLLGEIESHAPSADQPALRTSSVDEAIAYPDRLVFVVPRDEAATVEELDALRDRLLMPPRRLPVVLFLLRDGPGERALARCPGLASIVRGRDPDWDLLARADVDLERARFERETGLSPQAWLRKWKNGEFPETPELIVRSYRATALEGE